MTLTYHPQLGPMLRMSGSVTQLSTYTFRTRRGTTFTSHFSFDEDWKPIKHLRLNSWYDALGGGKSIRRDDRNGCIEIYVSQLEFHPFTITLQLITAGVTRNCA